MRRLYRALKIFYSKLLMRKSYWNAPWYIKLLMNVKGFTADQYFMYDLKHNRARDYITEYERWKTREINGWYRIVLDDKLLFAEVFGKYVDVPRNLVWINNGVLHDLKGSLLDKRKFDRILDANSRVIIKPTYKSGGGRGVSLIMHECGEYSINYRTVTYEDLWEFVRSQKNSIITEYVEQHLYAAELFERTTNTIRLISVIDQKTFCPQIVVAVQRIGTSNTIPCDNASMGALVAEVDVMSGILGVAKSNHDNLIHEIHPDSGRKILGTAIPGWEKIRQEILNLAARFPYVKFIAWDIVVTPNGFTIIEGNASSDCDLLQIHRGHRETELGQFFREQGMF